MSKDGKRNIISKLSVQEKKKEKNRASLGPPEIFSEIIGTGGWREKCVKTVRKCWVCLLWFNFGIWGYSVESKDYFQFCAQGWCWDSIQALWKLCICPKG